MQGGNGRTVVCVCGGGGGGMCVYTCVTIYGGCGTIIVLTESLYGAQSRP